MLLGEECVPKPTVVMGIYKPADPAVCVPGTVRNVPSGRFGLETIGFLGEPPFMAGPVAEPDRSGSENGIA